MFRVSLSLSLGYFNTSGPIFASLCCWYREFNDIIRDFNLYFPKRKREIERGAILLSRRRDFVVCASPRLLIISQIRDCGRVLSNDDRKGR